MFPVVPLPRWAGLAAAFAAAALDDDALAAPWRRGAARAFWFSRSAWSMAALARAATADRGRAPCVWLPGHFCDQSTQPLRATGARVVFYPVDAARARPDWDACRRLAGEAPPDLFVIVHVFGRANDGEGARAFADAHGAWLVEDAAHALGPAPGIGAAGDAVFYSPAKVLAVPAGGLVLARHPRIAAALETGGAATPVASWLARRAIQKLVPPPVLAARVRRGWPDFDHDPAPAPLPPTPGLGIAARRMIAHAGADMAAVAARRRVNADAFARALSHLSGFRPLFETDAAAPAPYRFVLRGDGAPALFDRWRAAGLPVETWPDLPPEVKAAPHRHAGAIELRATLLLLPVHQTLPDWAAETYRKSAA